MFYLCCGSSHSLNAFDSTLDSADKDVLIALSECVNVCEELTNNVWFVQIVL